MKGARLSKIFTTLKKNIRLLRLNAIDSVKKIETAAKETGNKSLIRISKEERKNLAVKITEINLLADRLQKDAIAEVKNNAAKRRSEIGSLYRQIDAADSNSFLLEYKKKELLLKQEELDKQADELRVANEELKTKSESLLDQSDYLHEANETIANMMSKLELQNQEILGKNEELLNLNLEKNNLIGIVAHDLKSPLNQIKGLLSLVKLTAKVDEESAKYLGMMEQSISRLNEMIAKILDVEAIESRKLNLKMEDVDLSEILSNVAERYKDDAEKKNIILMRNIEENVIVHADKNYAEQVLENLLSNAIKFSPFERTVFINLISQNGKAIGEVKDQGPGLSEEDKKKLFGKYQKLSAKPTGNEISTGLGLSIVKKFVEVMKGQIWCESELGKGASFFVEFKKS